MKIAICDVDGHGYPNLALMRISAYHKAKGDTVEWFMPLEHYDRVYASKVFTFTPDNPYLPPDTIRGGIGYDPASSLPSEIEDMLPDYTIYPKGDTAYGFLTRGCPNRCPWCVVPDKEGGLRIDGDIEEICNTNTGFRRKAILMDNNFLAAPLDFIREQAEKMKKLKVRVDFNQGTDARLYEDEDRAEIMAGIPWIRMVRMSCDTDQMVQPCIDAIYSLRYYGCAREILVYILARAEDIGSALDRIHRLSGYDKKVVPFVMPYRPIDGWQGVPAGILKDLARWCNRVWIRKSCSFEDYLKHKKEK